MKKMMRMAMMAAALFAVTTTTAKAQGGGGGGRGRGPNVMAVLKDSLKVSDAVYAKAEDINKKYMEEVAPLQEAMRGGDADARPKMTAARTKMMESIKALLTDAQKADFDKMVPAGGGRRGGL